MFFGRAFDTPRLNFNWCINFRWLQRIYPLTFSDSLYITPTPKMRLNLGIFKFFTLVIYLTTTCDYKGLPTRILVSRSKCPTPPTPLTLTRTIFTFWDFESYLDDLYLKDSHRRTLVVWSVWRLRMISHLDCDLTQSWKRCTPLWVLRNSHFGPGWRSLKQLNRLHVGPVVLKTLSRNLLRL